MPHYSPNARFAVLAALLTSLVACKEREATSVGLAQDAVAPAESADLDELYGAPFPPAYSKTWETNPDGSTIKNPGLQTCTSDVDLLVDPGQKQIWAILEDGTLVEGNEVVVGTAPSGKPLTLGHPTLTGAGEARIAGEIRWQGTKPVINNKSGRYSAHDDRGPDQLSAAAELFKTCGVIVKTKYVPMTSNDEP